MVIVWTKEARDNFSQIKSEYYTTEDTKEYKKRLRVRIAEQILILGRSIRSTHPDWHGTYKINVDKFVVLYSFSDDDEICNIEYFVHGSQIK